MPSGLLISLVLIPSMLLAYVVLTTFYGANRAYIAISWLPLAYVLIIWAFILVLDFQHIPDEWWRGLLITLGWAGLAQAALGVALIVRAISKREGAIGVTLATLLSASPFFLRFVRY
ncbi:MAG TPA: hypothetical protein VFH15_14925 [Pyrinomonadaceae bacterium]|nr:hypothetical protein [Pyrinomonadaceae bacterium]